MTVASESPKIPYRFVACPTYDGTIHGTTAMSMMSAAKKHAPVRFRVGSASLLCHNFNSLWCTAMNDPLITHFAMIHADIAAQFYWLDTMIDIMDERELTVLSALVPMKTGDGLTSTALDTPENRRQGPTQQRRLTMREAYRLPETFDVGDVCDLFGTDRFTFYAGNPGNGAFAPKVARALLFNTGLMVVDLAQFRELKPNAFPGFDITSRIVREADGSLAVSTEPEDWAFSRWCATQGLSTAVTRAVRVDHQGGHVSQVNDRPWGEWDCDRQYLDAVAAEAAVTEAPAESLA